MNETNNTGTGVCDSCGTNKHCGCGHHYIIPSAITLIGAAFLLEYFGYVSSQTVSLVWPILLIVIGVTKFCSCCKRY